MKAGKLKELIDVFEPQLVDDGYGGSFKDYLFLGQIWANVQVEEGDEHYENDKITWTSSYKIEVRANTGIDWSTDKVIKYENSIIHIRGQADKMQAGNRIHVRGIKGNPSDFPVYIESGVFDQTGLPMFDQQGNPVFTMAGV